MRSIIPRRDIPLSLATIADRAARAERYLRQAHYDRARDRAREVLKPGDRIRVTRCGGGAPTFTFLTFEGNAIVSKSGLDDLSAFSIIAVNGVPTSFRDDPAAHLANPFDYPNKGIAA